MTCEVAVLRPLLVLHRFVGFGVRVGAAVQRAEWAMVPPQIARSASNKYNFLIGSMSVFADCSHGRTTEWRAVGGGKATRVRAPIWFFRFRLGLFWMDYDSDARVCLCLDSHLGSMGSDLGSFFCWALDLGF